MVFFNIFLPLGVSFRDLADNIIRAYNKISFINLISLQLQIKKSIKIF
jgi:hypothetical protein